jgi:catechol 2,3-dioxygenase-like lactoylglutathione lyase family enzyme
LAELDHVGYMVADLERATRWLEDVLAVVPVGPIVSIPGTEIRVGAVLLGDFEWEIVEHPQARDGARPVADDALGAHDLTLQTSDLTDVRSHLSALGVAFYRNGSSLRFRDPDGFRYSASSSHPTEETPRVPGVFDGGVRSLGFNVRSLARSQEWYERSFGLAASPEPGGHSSLLMAGRVILRLRETDAAAASNPMTGMGPAHPAIEVEDLEVARERFERDGATFLIPPRRDDHEGSRRFGRSSFFVADPDGLPVQVIEPRR